MALNASVRYISTLFFTLVLVVLSILLIVSFAMATDLWLAISLGVGSAIGAGFLLALIYLAGIALLASAVFAIAKIGSPEQAIFELTCGFSLALLGESKTLLTLMSLSMSSGVALFLLLLLITTVVLINIGLGIWWKVADEKRDATLALLNPSSNSQPAPQHRSTATLRPLGGPLMPPPSSRSSAGHQTEHDGSSAQPLQLTLPTT